jgi:ABC-type multidrug transport system fused ATPase/permease subunit
MFVIPNVIDSSMLCRHHEEIHVCYEDTKNLFCSSLSPRKNGKDLLGTSLLDLLPANVIQVMQNEGTSLMTIHVGRTGFAGLSLVYGLTLSGTLVFFIQYVCQLANNIVSVERICQYMDIPSEAPAIIKDHRPPANWPLEGKIDLQNLQIRYRPTSPLVLKGITCTFKAGERIGVVGRTGSGKTTLISALFRLVEPAGGKILIDNLDIASIGLHDLRARLGIIPQEPTLFRGTVRTNMDPLEEHLDIDIWKVMHAPTTIIFLLCSKQLIFVLSGDLNIG